MLLLELLLELLLVEPVLPLLLLALVPFRNANGLVELGDPTGVVLMYYCPSFKVFSIMSREVFSTSTLFW